MHRTSLLYLITEAVRLLWSLGARNPERLVALSAIPVERVKEVIAAAWGRPTVIDKAGWAIAALSEGWDIAPPARKEDCDTLINVADYIGGQYGDLFRLGSDTSDLDGRAGHLELAEPGDQVCGQDAAPSSMRPGAGAALHIRHPAAQQPQPFAGEVLVPQPDASRRSAAELAEELCARLLLQCDRSTRPVIRGLQVRVDGETTVIHCASLADRLAVGNGDSSGLTGDRLV